MGIVRVLFKFTDLENAYAKTDFQNMHSHHPSIGSSQFITAARLN